MQKEKIIAENLNLLNEFMKYALIHPEILDKIPPDAELVILPINDTKLYNHNKRLAEKLKKKKKVVVFKMQKPKLIKPELVKI